MLASGILPLCDRSVAGTFDRDNGGGFLTDHFPHATKAVWWDQRIALWPSMHAHCVLACTGCSGACWPLSA